MLEGLLDVLSRYMTVKLVNMRNWAMVGLMDDLDDLDTNYGCVGAPYGLGYASEASSDAKSREC